MRVYIFTRTAEYFKNIAAVRNYLRYIVEKLNTRLLYIYEFVISNLQLQLMSDGQNDDVGIEYVFFFRPTVVRNLGYFFIHDKRRRWTHTLYTVPLSSSVW